MTDGCIYVIDPQGGLIRMDQADYYDEKSLQELIANHPHLLAGDQMNEESPRRWVLIGRELGIPVEEEGGNAFSLDHLYLDQDAVPTLVEVKRSSDSRIRREVVGQMLDYAANAAAFWSADELRARFEGLCEQQQVDPEEELSANLGDDMTYEAYWQRLGTNLAARHMRLLFVADRLPPELRRIIEFLNAAMTQVEVLGLELRQYRHDTTRALVPRVVGQSSVAARSKGTATKADRSAFLSAWNTIPATRTLYQQLLDYAESEGLVVSWGRRGFSIRVETDSRRVSLAQGFPPDCFGGPIYILSLYVSRLGLADTVGLTNRWNEMLARVPSMSVQKSGWRLDPQRMRVEDMNTLIQVIRQMADVVRTSNGGASQ